MATEVRPLHPAEGNVPLHPAEGNVGSKQGASMKKVIIENNEKETKEEDTRDDINRSVSSMANEVIGVPQIAKEGDNTTTEVEDSHRAHNTMRMCCGSNPTDTSADKLGVSSNRETNNGDKKGSEWKESIASLQKTTTHNGQAAAIENSYIDPVPQVTVAASYERAMRIVLEKPVVKPNVAPATDREVRETSSYELAMKTVLDQPAYAANVSHVREKSLSDVGLENDEENYYNKGDDFNTVAEISYVQNEKNCAKKEIMNSVSWHLATSEGKNNSAITPESNDGICVLKETSIEEGKVTRSQGSALRESGTFMKKSTFNRVNTGHGTTNEVNMEINKVNTSKKKENFQEDPTPPPPLKEKSFISQMMRNAYYFIYPKLDPLPCSTFLALTIYAAIPAVLYILAFTKIGYGLAVFSFIYIHLEPIAHYLGGMTVAFAMSLYLLDCYYWSGYSGAVCRRLCLGILITLLFSFIFALSAEHPYGPVGIFLFATTSWMVAVRLICYRNIASKRYISWLSGPLLIVSQGVALYWLCWTLAKEENEWNMINNLASAEAAGCKPNFDKYPQCDIKGNGEVCFEVDAESSSIEFEYYCQEVCTKVYDSCLNSFIIWGGPFLVSVGFFFLSFVASFLRGDGSAEQNIGKLAKSWMFLLFSMWISSCLAGAGTGISTTLTALTFSAFTASAVFLIFGYTSYEREERILSLWDKITEKYASLLDSIRGLLIITSTPIGLAYISISFVRQFLRNLNFCCSTRPNDTMSLKHIGGAGWLTVEARRLIRLVKSWDRTKVFTYAIYWGIAFMVLSVIVAEFSILFLSYMIEKTSDMNIALVTVILSLAGLVMFLLPPVPGVPIYLTLGIVIVPVGREQFGILGSIIYAMIVSLCLKLTACTLQQKMIGGLLQHKVGVRQFVGINSKLIRSMKLVLREKGFGIAKVAILIGGPDWPTSVLCGIMDLPLIPILIGTLPIVLLILPTLLTGSFTYMSSLRDEETGEQEFPWAATMATVAAAVTGIVQFGSMIVAAFYVEKAVSDREEELNSLPIDQEVKEADDKLEEENKAYSEVTQWHRVPLLAKLVLYLSLICMILSCYMVQLFSDNCFAEYDLTYTIDQHLDGKWTNIVKPLGLAALVLFSVSIVLLQIFTKWAKNKAGSGGIAVHPKGGEYAEKIKNDQVTSIDDLRTKYVRA